MPAPLLISQHSGFTEWLHTNDGENFTIQRTADVEPVIDANKRTQNDNPTGMGASKEWQHVARIPVMVQLEWIEKFGADPLAKGNEKLLKRLLNSNEYRWLRTSQVYV